MNIAIDIDDTLADSFEYFQPFVAEYFGIGFEEVREKNISYGNLPKEWQTKRPGFTRTYYDRVVPDTPFKPDAAGGVSKLKDRSTAERTCGSVRLLTLNPADQL